MNKLTLHVKNFGKIKSADVEVKPLTLFVGDNNSGKSYLLSLIWLLKNPMIILLIFLGFEKEIKNFAYSGVKADVEELISGTSVDEQIITIPSAIFENFVNNQLDKNKQLIISGLFNFANVNIDEVRISLPRKSYKIRCNLNKVDDIYQLKVMLDQKTSIFERRNNKDITVEHIIYALFRSVMIKALDLKLEADNCYFPAARTGFVLSRKVINQNLRRRAFDEDLEEKIAPLQQFTKPILDFLDMLEMSGNGKTDYKKLAQWIEENLAHGTYTYINDQSMELGFVPKNNKDAMPMRVASAVVTEVSPLIVLLKNSRNINSICYEEPEMCLHPQLQLYMARCLAKMVNKKIDIIATTHSDIILQHISNVCVLANHAKKEELLSSLHYDEDDVLDIKDVAVYQFTEESDGSSVTRLAPEGNAFNIPTFNDALGKIFESTYKINNEDSF